MKLEYRDGLIFTNIEIVYKSNHKMINNIIIDTGASISLISPDAVDDIGIFAEAKDKIITSIGIGGYIHNSFEKEIDKIIIDNNEIEKVKLDFGIIDTNSEINGLLGLDILIGLKAIIDLDNMIIKFDWYLRR